MRFQALFLLVFSCFGHSIQTTPPPSKSAADLIYCSVDEGFTWLAQNEGLRPDDVISSVLATDQGRMMLLTNRGLMSYNPQSLAYSLLQGLTLPDSITRIYPGSRGIYLNKYPKGIYRWTPGTDIYLPLHQNLPDKSVYSMKEIPDGSLLVGTEAGLYRSTNNGLSWQKVFEAPDVSSLNVGQNVVVAVSSKGIARSTDGGLHWSWVQQDKGEFKLVSKVHNRLYAFIREKGVWLQVPLEENGGEVAGSVNLSAFRMVFQLITAGQSILCSHPDGVSRSMDGGRTWELVLPVPNRTLNFSLIQIGTFTYAIKTSGC